MLLHVIRGTVGVEVSGWVNHIAVTPLFLK